MFLRFIVLLGFVCSLTLHAQVISCTDANGKKQFTDDPSLCKGKETKKIVLKNNKDKRANYRYPQRNYEKVSSQYTIYFEVPENSEDLRLQKKAIKKLEKALDFVFSQLPLRTHAQLKAVNYYLMLGERSLLGGENNGLRYISKGGVKRYSLYDKRWDNSIVIYSVDNFLYHGELWTHQPLCHELAHAWHLLNWSSKYAPIYDAWMNSRRTSLYLSVENYKGDIVSPAYASTNQLEYFADLSAMFFVGGSYFPFDRKGLKQYDPTGYELISTLWFGGEI